MPSGPGVRDIVNTHSILITTLLRISNTPRFQKLTIWPVVFSHLDSDLSAAQATICQNDWKLAVRSYRTGYKGLQVPPAAFIMASNLHN